MRRKVFSELFGTAIFLLVMISSYHLGFLLSNGIVAVALLIMSLASAGILTILFATLSPYSNVLVNPAVSVALAIQKEICPGTAAAYIVAQIIGAIIGVTVSNIIFMLPIAEFSHINQHNNAMWVGEFIGTLILLKLIMLARKQHNQCHTSTLHCPTPLLGIAISVLFWAFPSGFLNPAVEFARTYTVTGIGISPACAAHLISAQLLAAIVIGIICRARLHHGCCQPAHCNPCCDETTDKKNHGSHHDHPTKQESTEIKKEQ